MTKRILIILCGLFLLFDLGYSFLQHYGAPLDGDMSGGIVPAKEVQRILDNPLGLEALNTEESYPNPNRFFCHWTYYQYFNSVPYLFQKFTSPLNSVYLSCALAKTIIQLGLIMILSLFASGKIWDSRFLIAAVIITPLFQTNGYQNYMGIIDPSTTYSFFYALPLLIMAVYFLPLFLQEFYGKSSKWFRYLKFLWIPLALTVALSGPLNPGITLIISLLIMTSVITRSLKHNSSDSFFRRLVTAIKNIPSAYYFYLLPICIFSIYSLFLGTYSSSEWNNQKSLTYLFSRLPDGIYYIFTRKLGFPLLLISIAANYFLIKLKIKSKEGNRLLALTRWIFLFALIYILLLPFGGYREYRPNILRYDTMIPVTVSLIFIFAKTSLFLVSTLRVKKIRFYPYFVLIILGVFTIADKPEFERNQCERNAIKKLAESQETIVELSGECKILSWSKIYDPLVSEEKCELLKKWNVLDEKKLFYQRK